MDEAIRQQIEANEIGAIALDTEVFDAKQLTLEVGLLRRVAQFADSEISVLMPDVIAGEIEAHLLQAASEAQGKLKRAMRLIDHAKLLSLVGDAKPATQLLEQIADPAAAAEIASQRLAGWIERTGAVVLQASDHVTLDQVMLRYFGAQAPFAASGPKKHEFPDAVALLTLERWAEQQERKVLVVSNDPDWVRYCATSPRLVAVRDLADALSGFQDQTASYAARRLAELLNEGDSVGLQRALLQALDGQDDKVEFEVDADSQFELEPEGVAAHFIDVELPDPEWAKQTFEAVDYGDGKVFVQIAATAVAEVSSYFRFRKWDGIDREYMSMGSGHIVTEERINVEAIVTLGGQIPERLEIEAIEILPQTHHIELSDIEPDWMSDPDNYDTYDRE
ncbi:hypothetical protein PPGU19_093060 (plasmid) [Paraburkholderia sp. PGU19]|uniref:PIN domain-containing protein n=1 Tax=Paraburkholderia sp. PGU19 TaxID=2735434 RepID=UPI0015DB3369|nr:PIN domain-containing protein [Paraburkholderia sp. PGU19]BCG04738.1 hypothetical protein PPGU19_093060 [Paraburkholderia sp. PGU19]